MASYNKNIDAVNVIIQNVSIMNQWHKLCVFSIRANVCFVTKICYEKFNFHFAF